MVGSLIYLTITRPNIAFSIGLASLFMQAPRKPHLEAVKRIVKYVNSTLDIALLYKKRAGVSLVGYLDANLGSNLDDRRFTSGYVFCVEEQASRGVLRSKIQSLYLLQK